MHDTWHLYLIKYKTCANNWYVLHLVTLYYLQIYLQYSVSFDTLLTSSIVISMKYHTISEGPILYTKHVIGVTYSSELHKFF